MITGCYSDYFLADKAHDADRWIHFSGITGLEDYIDG